MAVPVKEQGSAGLALRLLLPGNGPLALVGVDVCRRSVLAASTALVLLCREADRVILTTCQEKGAHLETFQAISQKLGNKTASEVRGWCGKPASAAANGEGLEGK